MDSILPVSSGADDEHDDYDNDDVFGKIQPFL